MRYSKLFLIALLLSGCNSKVSSSISSSKLSSSFKSEISLVSSSSSTISSEIISSLTSTSSSSTSTDSEGWKEEERLMMEGFLGREIPYISFSVDYSVIIDEDNYGEFLYVYADFEDVSKVNQYVGIVEGEGYSLMEVRETYYGYPKYYYGIPVSDSDRLVVDFNYYPGNGNINPCVEIYAWVEPNDDGFLNQGGENLDDGFTICDGFPTEVINSFLSRKNKVDSIPAYPAINYRYQDGGDFVVVASYEVEGSETTIEAQYTKILEENSWELYYYDMAGYLAYSPNKEIAAIFSTILGRFQVTYVAIEPQVFPSEDIKAYLNEKGVDVEVPSYEASDYTSTRCPIEGLSDDAFLLYSSDPSNTLTQTYKEILISNGWSVETSEDGVDNLATYGDSKVNLYFYHYEGDFYVILYV